MTGTLDPTEWIGQTVYCLDLTRGSHRQALRGIHDVFHVGLLKPNQNNGMAATAPPIIVDDNEKHRIEKIL